MKESPASRSALLTVPGLPGLPLDQSDPRPSPGRLRLQEDHQVHFEPRGCADKCLQCLGGSANPEEIWGTRGMPVTSMGLAPLAFLGQPASRASCRGHLWCTGGALKREEFWSAGPWGQEALVFTEGGCHLTPTRCVFKLKPGVPRPPCGAAGRSACSVASGLGPLQASLSFPTPGTDVCLWVSKRPLQLLPSSGAWGHCDLSRFPCRLGAPPPIHSLIPHPLMPSCVPGPVPSRGVNEGVESNE